LVSVVVAAAARRESERPSTLQAGGVQTCEQNSGSPASRNYLQRGVQLRRVQPALPLSKAFMYISQFPYTGGAGNSKSMKQRTMLFVLWASGYSLDKRKTRSSYAQLAAGSSLAGHVAARRPSTSFHHSLRLSSGSSTPRSVRSWHARCSARARLPRPSRSHSPHCPSPR
jgi:hypothetical protein